MINVLFYNHLSTIGGAERSMLDIIKRLDRRRFQPILCLPGPGPLWARAQELGVPVFSVELPVGVARRKKDEINWGSLRNLSDGFRLLPAIFRLVRVIKAQRADIVYTHTLKSHLIGGAAAFLAGIPAVWHLRDILVSPAHRRFITLSGKLLARAIIAPSQAVAGQFSGGRVTVIPNGFDLTELRERAGSGGRVLAELGLPPQSRLISMASYIAPVKGQHIFLAAAEMLAPKYPDLHFAVIGGVLFGDQWYEESIKGQAGSPALRDRVSFTGQIDEPLSMLKASRVVAVPSLVPEAFGRTAAEAMALEVPVVASRIGALPEVINDGAEGILVEPGNIGELAGAMERLLNDAVLRERVIQGGRSKVEREYSMGPVLAAIERVLEKAAGK